MLNSIQSYLPVAVISAIVGFVAGYSYSDSQAEIDKLNAQQTALKSENQNLIKKLEVEYEHQKTAQISVAKTQEDLAVLESKYNDAISELNLLQLQSDSSGNDTSTLPSDATTTTTVSDSGCQCSRSDKAAFQKLLDEQMILAKDCDINATYLNHLIKWYNQISQEHNNQFIERK